MLYLISEQIDDVTPVHLEVLLPAFVLGCMLKRPMEHDPYIEDTRGGDLDDDFENPKEQHVTMIVTAIFMVLVGLSMPVIAIENGKWNILLGHVVLITVLSNIGKMFPLICYRKEATVRERLALSISMFPRGEVGAGVLVISMSYGLTGAAITVATLALALNLLLTGVFIAIVKKLLEKKP